MLLCDLACVRADYPVATLPDDEGPEFISSEGLEGYQEIIEHILYGLLQIMWGGKGGIRKKVRLFRVFLVFFCRDLFRFFFFFLGFI